MKRFASRRSPRWTEVLLSLLLFVGVPAVVGGAIPVVQVSDSDPPDVYGIASCTQGSESEDLPGQMARGGVLYYSSEVEPWVDVNPTDPQNIVGTWQQDRWSDGGSRGLRIVWTKNGGSTWSLNNVRTTLCTGGTAATGADYQRASDPWLSFGPTGTLYHVGISFQGYPALNRTGGFGPNGLLVSRSMDGGATWSDPITVIKDTDPRFLNDKEALTADPNDSNFAYLVWDRLKLPEGTVINPENLGAIKGVGFTGPAMLARTTNGGASWEEPRVLYNPGANNQTIANQIVVLPADKGGTLIDVTNEILSFKNPMGEGKFVFNIAVLRSPDKGVTWPVMPIRVTQIEFVPVTDPNTGEGVRTGDIIPEVAVDRHGGNLYVVWQDGRFSGFGRADVAFMMSTDGGLTWTTPVAINKTQMTRTGYPASSDPRHAFTPSVRVAKDGTVAVTYYDFRSLAPGNKATLPTDYWVVTCNPSSVDCTNAASWSEEHISGPFDMRQAPKASGFFVGDYEGLGAVVMANVPGFQSLFVKAVKKTTDPSTTNPSDAFSATILPPP